MPDPIITDWIALSTLNPRGFKVTGSNFTATTPFCLKDVTPGKLSPAVWSPSTAMPATAPTSPYTDAEINSNMTGGASPPTGVLQIGTYGSGGISNVQSIRKTYAYSGMLEAHKHKHYPVVVEFTPETFTYGKEVAILLTGVHFNDETKVILNEVYVHGVVWCVDNYRLVGHQIIVVTAHVTREVEQIPGPGFLEATVIGEDNSVQSVLRKLITYKAPG
jgi:hypothetical protein